jgi:ubiquinone/menaquinone biosynthesis C-methylase UbiE
MQNKSFRASPTSYNALNYIDYWNGRDYIHQSEIAALRRLLGNNRYNNAIDIGGGFGRLSVILKQYADHVTIFDPSIDQIQAAKKYTKGHTDIDFCIAEADDLPVQDSSVDIATMIRVLHHFGDPVGEFKELARVLKVGGVAVIEFANNDNLRRRMGRTFGMHRASKKSVSIKSNIVGGVAYVGHHPKTIRKLLSHEGLKVNSVLSVGNLRLDFLTNRMPVAMLMPFEKLLQKQMAKISFGPRLFFLVEKLDDKSKRSR